MGEPVEQREAESAPAICTSRGARGADDARGLFEQRRGLLTPGRCSTRASSAFVEALGAARAQLEVRGADHRVDDFAGGAGDAAVGDGDREQQRDGDRDAEAGEQLLGGVHAQPPPVEVESA